MHLYYYNSVWCLYENTPHSLLVFLNPLFPVLSIITSLFEVLCHKVKLSGQYEVKEQKQFLVLKISVFFFFFWWCVNATCKAASLHYISVWFLPVCLKVSSFGTMQTCLVCTKRFPCGFMSIKSESKPMFPCARMQKEERHTFGKINLYSFIFFFLHRSHNITM